MPLDIIIDPTPGLAITGHSINDTAHPEARRIYTDGSGVQDQIGCSAIALEPLHTSQAYLGTARESSVPLAELTGHSSSPPATQPSKDAT
jgi:hypothetical protein